MSAINVNSITGRTGTHGPVLTGVTTVSADLNVTGNVTIGGTLTYEDVTNIDSVGIITAQGGIRIGTGGTVGPVGSGIVTYYGDGSNLTGIAADKIFEGNTEVETVDAGSNGHIKFTTEGTERVRIKSDGKVGIGTASPTQILELKTGEPRLCLNGTIAGSDKGIEFEHNGTRQGHLLHNPTSGEMSLSVGENTGGAHYLTFKSGNGTEKMRITSNGDVNNLGNVGVQTSYPTSASLVGAASSLIGLYIGDGHLLFSDNLSRPGGYYIPNGLNALNAGPVTLGSTMTLDGVWVIV